VKRLAPIGFLAVLLTVLLSASAQAAARADCGRTVIEDWYANGDVDKLYPLGCYRSALEHLPVDLSSSVRQDIERAYEYARRGKLAPPSPATAARRAYAEWSAALRAGAVRDPARRFANPPIEALRRRLRDVEQRFDLRARQVYVRWPRQQAPYVVVSTNRPAALARAVPAILRILDPKRPTGDDRTGWPYEGFFFEALDANGQPFLVVFNHWRGPHAGGGQWTASKDLYPFAHG
jgi:hypothetical protein